MLDPFWIKCAPYLKAFVRKVHKTAAIEKASGKPDPYKSALQIEQAWLEGLLEGRAQELEASTVLGQPVTMALGRLLNPSRERSFTWQRDQELKNVMRHAIYIVRDGERVLYVGSTRRGPRHRLRSHVHANSILGAAIKRESGSAHWTVEMLPMATNRSAVQRERELIREHRPKYSLQ